MPVYARGGLTLTKKLGKIKKISSVTDSVTDTEKPFCYSRGYSRSATLRRLIISIESIP